MIKKIIGNQLYLLNFYKILSSISANLVGAFIPLIIYKYTGSIILAVVYIMAIVVVRLIVTAAFKNLMFKYAQLFILFRIIPIILISVFVLLLDVNVIVGIIGVGVSVGFANAFSNLPNELIHNYSSVGKGSSSLGISVFFEKIGVILAYVAGGLFLDHLDQWIVIIISLVLYLISVIPLIMYFVKNKKNQVFNKETISNAALTFEDVPVKKKRGRILSKKLITNYTLIYMIYNIMSPLMSIFNLYLFIQTGVFSMVGYLTAIYNAAIMIVSLFAGKLDKKYDLTLFVWLGFFISGVGIILLPMINNIWVWAVIFIILGGIEAINHVFILERLRMKTRIMGVSNKALFYRHVGQSSGAILSSLLCISFLSFGFLPIFVIMGISNIITGTYAVVHEEESRKTLVSYLGRYEYEQENIDSAAKPHHNDII